MVYDLSRCRRTNERKNYQMEVLFSTGAMIFPATLKNISIGGARVGSRNISKIKTGAEIIITIPFANKQGCMKRKAIVMWAEKDQFGIQFNRRKNRRKNYQKDSSFSTGATIFPATLKDISMEGACVGSRNISKIKAGAEITITIPFAKKQGFMKKKAIVMWAKNDQFGIKFI